MRENLESVKSTANIMLSTLEVLAGKISPTGGGVFNGKCGGSNFGRKTSVSIHAHAAATLLLQQLKQTQIKNDVKNILNSNCNRLNHINRHPYFKQDAVKSISMKEK